MENKYSGKALKKIARDFWGADESADETAGWRRAQAFPHLFAALDEYCCVEPDDDGRYHGGKSILERLSSRHSSLTRFVEQVVANDTDGILRQFLKEERREEFSEIVDTLHSRLGDEVDDIPRPPDTHEADILKAERDLDSGDIRSALEEVLWRIIYFTGDNRSDVAEEFIFGVVGRMLRIILENPLVLWTEDGLLEQRGEVSSLSLWTDDFTKPICVSLPYQAGNAGDFIKHAALVLYVNWRMNDIPDGKKVLSFADPFGGRPFTLPMHNEVAKRLDKFPRAEITDCLRDGSCYNNSSHIIRNAARMCGGKADVLASDNRQGARDALKESGLRLINEAYPDYTPGNGYSILDYAEDFDLVLLDPYKNFLPCEVSLGFPILTKIKNIVESPAEGGGDVCVALFVLDWKKNHIHHAYVDFKRENLKDIAISLRCPKMPGKHRLGEEKYDMEILLISRLFAKGGGEKLHERLRNFRNVAEDVLPLVGDKRIELWPE